MDNSISANLSFKAKLVPQMAHKPKVLSSICKEFTRKTENYEIPMEILSGGQEYPGAIFFELRDKIPTSFCITNASEKLGFGKKKLTLFELDNATTFLVRIYKILREQKAFATANEPINANLFSAKKAKFGNERLLAKAEIQKKENLIKTYQTLVRSNTMRINTLTKEKNALKENYLSKIQTISGDDEQLQEFVKNERMFID